MSAKPRTSASVWDQPAADGSPTRAFFAVRPADPAVRPLPWPFRGALAISNDAEYLSPEFFEALMQFLNTRGASPFGPGLGLAVTSSVFFYTAHARTFSYFEGAAADAPRSRVADRLDDYLRAGWIDTIHAYGDFDDVGGCTRAHALRTFETLQKLGVRLEVFSNHGGAENVQNVGTDAAYHRGDQRGHPAYHADLLGPHGVRYVWTDSMVTPIVREGGKRAALRRWLMPPPAPNLLEKCRLQDGNEFLGFRRLRGTGQNAPNLSSWHLQVDQIDWPAMYENWGATVVYQHLGVLNRVNGVCEAATVPAVQARPELYLAPFRRLQAEQERANLWVAGCAELLRYVEMVREVTVRREADGGTLVVEFPRKVEAPAEFFAGLTIAVPNDAARPTKVIHAGRELAADWHAPTADASFGALTVRRPTRKEIW